MIEKNPLLTNIKILQEKTGFSLQECKKALDQSNNDVNQAILWFRENDMVQPLSKNEILNMCSLYAVEWAMDFLEATIDTGELKKCFNSDKIDMIRDNFYSWYVVGMPGISPFLIFKKELNYLTDEENEEFENEVKELYDNAVAQLLPDYIQPNWRSLKKEEK